MLSLQHIHHITLFFFLANVNWNIANKNGSQNYDLPKFFSNVMM